MCLYAILDDDVLKQLKAAAKANGRSLQAEIHDVLRRAGTRNLARDPPSVSPVAKAFESLAALGQRGVDSRGPRGAMSVFVVDASLVVKWFVPEIYSEAAQRWLASSHEFYCTRPTVP
jgi:plasmid stability protein